MKLKRWLSRGIVLAMVVALMVPMPVAAKSSKAGGKLVKTVTYYHWNANGNRWEKGSKVDFTYDKKGNPVKVDDTSYGNHFLGVPTAQSTETSTAKFKYKGKSLKSMKERNEAKSVIETRKYKGGKAVNVMSTKYDSEFIAQGVEKVTVTDENTAYTYNKNGLVVSTLSTVNKTYNDGTKPGVRYDAMNYAVTESKGVPSLIQAIDGGSSWSDADGAGQEAAVTYPDDYSLFNGKGLVIEEGYYKDDKAAAHEAYRWVEYTMKKGKVTQAVVYANVWDEEKGVAVKQPLSRITFKYAKKSISKVRYLSMINDLVGTWNSEFNWY